MLINTSRVWCIECPRRWYGGSFYQPSPNVRPTWFSNRNSEKPRYWQVNKLSKKPTTNLDVRTSKFSNKNSFFGVDSNVKKIAVRITHQNIPSFGYVDTIWKHCRTFASKLSQTVTLFIYHHDSMRLEVANIKLFSCTKNLF